MAIKFSVLTLFPELIENYIAYGVIGRACKAGVASVNAVNIRDFTTDRHQTVDDLPFGGGAGMVLKPEPLAQAVESLENPGRRILLAPSGRPFTQNEAIELAKEPAVTLVCGRYEGLDERFVEEFIDDVLSIGDYVLSGGELGALVVLDAVMRNVHGVLGNEDSLETESFSNGLLEHPHYTRPAVWRDKAVPDVLLSGHHGHINDWRRRTSLLRTLRTRKDLLKTAEMTAEEREWLNEMTTSRTKRSSEHERD
jgi:tRNA (guanine37-N1)-methyltransferase